MNLHYYVDENILASLLTSSEACWQTTYSHYRESFENYFQRSGKLSPAESREAYQKAFALLLQGLKDEIITIPLNRTLFAHLVSFGYEVLESERRSVVTARIPQKPNLAGEILILLIKEGHEDPLLEIVRHYPEQICLQLKTKYYFINESPTEIISDTLTTLNANINKGYLRLPRTGRLFTYTYRIARNKFLASNNRLQPLDFLEDEEKMEKMLARRNGYGQDTQYVDYVADLRPELAPLLTDRENAFDNLVSLVDEKYREVLRLRFYENLRHRAIGERLNIKEGTARKRLNDALIHWKKAFFKDEQQ